MESHIEISIFDLRGQKVEALVNEFSQPGNHSVNWDASQVASGVYFVHFTASGDNTLYVSQIQKLMLVKLRRKYIVIYRGYNLVLVKPQIQL